MVNDATVPPPVPPPDPWWLLRRQAEAQCGPDAVFAAHLRASAAALRTTPVDGPDWHQAFLAAFAAELRSLLRP